MKRCCHVSPASLCAAKQVHALIKLILKEENPERISFDKKCIVDIFFFFKHFKVPDAEVSGKETRLLISVNKANICTLTKRVKSDAPKGIQSQKCLGNRIKANRWFRNVFSV